MSPFCRISSVVLVCFGNKFAFLTQCVTLPLKSGADISSKYIYLPNNPPACVGDAYFSDFTKETTQICRMIQRFGVFLAQIYLSAPNVWHYHWNQVLILHQIIYIYPTTQACVWEMHIFVISGGEQHKYAGWCTVWGIFPQLHRWTLNNKWHYHWNQVLIFHQSIFIHPTTPKHVWGMLSSVISGGEQHKYACWYTVCGIFGTNAPMNTH
jgi:hypothetical protein